MASEHLFSLIPQNPSCHYQPITVDFSPPPKQPVSDTSPNKPSNSIVPAFLNDKKFYTPAFVLPRGMVLVFLIQDYFITAHEFEKGKFQERILKEHRLHTSCSQAFPPAAHLTLPVPFSTFCQICKSSYTEYTSHITDSHHLHLSRLSKANTYIKQLQLKISKENQDRQVSRALRACRKGVKADKEAGRKEKGIQKGKGRGPRRRPEEVRKDANLNTHAPSPVPSPVQ